MLTRSLIVAAVIFVVPSAHAQQIDCTKIQDAQARLACYDKAPRTVKKSAATPIDEFAPAKRAMLRKLTDPESARWDSLFRVDGGDDGAIVCGMVNSKNQMGGYSGMTGFVYLPKFDQSVLMFNGVADPVWAARGVVGYCKYCAADPRGYDKIRPHCH